MGFIDKHFRRIIEATIEIVVSEKLKLGDNILWFDREGSEVFRCEIVWKAKDERQTYPFIEVIRKHCDNDKIKISLHKDDWFYRIKSCKEEKLEIVNGDIKVVDIEEWKSD